MTNKISIASKLYVRMPINPKGGLDPTSDVLQMGLSKVELTPPDTLIVGQWVTEVGRYWAYLLVGPGSPYGDVPPGRYWLVAKVTDNPEVPVLFSSNQLVFG
jgi:hypothetical protein